ncbi:DUF362 domain-containing protein [Candidatus Woesearchaeota archaeon]|nr:DUF362 domain-containing protein [Candidatus Woesearchaeota archaeon]
MKSKVTVLKTSPNTVIKDYSTLLDRSNYKKFISKDINTILKLNLSWSKYFPACSTEPWQLEGVVNKMKKEGYKKIMPVENRTVVTDVWKGAIGNKWLPILKKYNLKYQPLTEVEWINYKPRHEMLAIDKIFKDGHQIPKIFLNTNVIHLNTLKCHGHTTVTGSMKNAFGGLITEKRHHCHKMIHEVLVDLLQIQKEIHKGIFAVADGTICGDGNGPRTMIPKIKNYILASDDQVAIDAISAKMMGFDPLKIPFIKIAHDKGLGNGDINQIDIIGENINKINFGFSTGKSPVIFFDQLFRKGSFNFLEPLLFHTGLFNLCIFGSEFYHDYLWYNTIGRHRINKFKKTEWGKLFDKY